MEIRTLILGNALLIAGLMVIWGLFGAFWAPVGIAVLLWGIYVLAVAFKEYQWENLQTAVSTFMERLGREWAQRASVYL